MCSYLGGRAYAVTSYQLERCSGVFLVVFFSFTFILSWDVTNALNVTFEHAGISTLQLRRSLRKQRPPHCSYLLPPPSQFNSTMQQRYEGSTCALKE